MQTAMILVFCDKSSPRKISEIMDALTSVTLFKKNLIFIILA